MEEKKFRIQLWHILIVAAIVLFVFSLFGFCLMNNITTATKTYKLVDGESLKKPTAQQVEMIVRQGQSLQAVFGKGMGFSCDEGSFGEGVKTFSILYRVYLLIAAVISLAAAVVFRKKNKAKK